MTSPMFSFKWKSPMLKASLNEAVGLPPQMDLSSDKTMTVSDAPLVSVNTASDNNTTADKKDIDDIKFTAEPERYQLFVNESNALSQVVTIALALKQLDNVIFVNIVKHEDGEHLENVACADCDISITKVRIREFAKVMQTLFQGRTFPIPLLYDMHLHEVVSTESDVILRFLNDLFNEYSGNPDLNLVPDYPAVAAELDMVESQLLGQINRCIGDAAQAHAKETFDTASRNLHEGLKEMNDKLGERFFLCGDEITEADLIEFVALYRYDPLLSSVFTVDDKKILIQDAYPHIWTWLQRIYNMPGVAGTCDLYEVFNSRSFQRTFGIRIKELGVEFALDWEEQYIAKLALDDRPYVGGDDDGDEVEEQEAGENGHANKKRKL